MSGLVSGLVSNLVTCKFSEGQGGRATDLGVGQGGEMDLLIGWIGDVDGDRRRAYRQDTSYFKIRAC